MKIGICDTILALNPTAQVSVSGDDVNKITWHNGTQPITKNIILAKQLELQAEEDNKLAQQESKKQSAIAKLKALGLDEEEVKAILGV
jgi:hypothetical protein